MLLVLAVKFVVLCPPPTLLYTGVGFLSSLFAVLALPLTCVSFQFAIIQDRTITNPGHSLPPAGYTPRNPESSRLVDGFIFDHKEEDKVCKD
jgi:hypothetical protein